MTNVMREDLHEWRVFPARGNAGTVNRNLQAIEDIDLELNSRISGAWTFHDSGQRFTNQFTTTDAAQQIALDLTGCRIFLAQLDERGAMFSGTARTDAPSSWWDCVWNRNSIFQPFGQPNSGAHSKIYRVSLDPGSLPWVTAAAFGDVDVVWQDTKPSPLLDEQSRDKPSTIRSLIEQIRNLDWPFRDRLSARVEELVSLAEEEEFANKLSDASLQDLVRFFRVYANIACPRVGHGLDGHFGIEWREGKTRFFSIDFLGGNRIKYAAVGPDSGDPSKSSYAAGVVTLEALTEQMPRVGVLGWLLI